MAGGERDVIIFLNAGVQARIRVRLVGTWIAGQRGRGALCSPGPPVEFLARDGARAAETASPGRLLRARVTAGPPDWRADSNRVDLKHRGASVPLPGQFEALGASRVGHSIGVTFAASGAAERSNRVERPPVRRQERGYHFARVTPGARR